MKLIPRKKGDRMSVRSARMVIFSGWIMQRDWILERNREINEQYKQYPHLSRYSTTFI